MSQALSIVHQLQMAELARIVDKFLELKPEYSGAFWDSMQFAEFVMGRFDKIELEELEKVVCPF